MSTSGNSLLRFRNEVLYAKLPSHFSAPEGVNQSLVGVDSASFDRRQRHVDALDIRTELVVDGSGSHVGAVQGVARRPMGAIGARSACVSACEGHF